MSADVNVRISKETRAKLKVKAAEWQRDTGVVFTLGNVIDVLVANDEKTSVMKGFSISSSGQGTVTITAARMDEKTRENFSKQFENEEDNDGH